MTRYLVHNIYGDADLLIAAAPEDVVCVPAGWSPECEAARNDLLASLGRPGVSCYPCLLYWRAEHTVTDPDLGEIVIPAAWRELRIADMARPWSWEAIDDALLLAGWTAIPGA